MTNPKQGLIGQQVVLFRRVCQIVVTRREKIESMLLDEPKDVFLRYALAMEMEKASEIQSALDVLIELTQESPPHVASFFRTAQILFGQNQIETSRKFLREGIDAARDADDLHAAAEMSEMLAQLGAYPE